MIFVDVTENKKDDAEISDADISFFINLFPDGYSIGNPSENRANQATVQDDPKFLHPYDRTSESMFTAIERGLLPADFLDDIPCKYVNGTVACVVRDYRNCGLEAGVNGSSADSSTPITSKIRLKMSLENVVKDMHLISNSSWTYGDLMEAEARILMALNPKLDLDPFPNVDRLCKPPTSTNVSVVNLIILMV
ncbi:putative transcription factor Spt20 [Helianthus annuus]|nr:putative transcription factor Spt20 [Helianthus annuus]